MSKVVPFTETTDLKRSTSLEQNTMSLGLGYVQDAWVEMEARNSRNMFGLEDCMWEASHR